MPVTGSPVPVPGSPVPEPNTDDNSNFFDKSKFNFLTLVTSACFSVGKTSEGGVIRPFSPFEDTEWSDKKKL